MRVVDWAFIKKWLNPIPALPVLFLLLAVLVFFARVLFGGRVLVPGDILFSALPWKAFAAQFGAAMPHNELLSDMLFQNLAWKNFAREAVSQGALPLWNPYIFAGEPFLAAGQAGVLYPLGFVFYLLPPVWAYGWFTAMHFFLAGLLMYLFLRLLGANRTGALVSALAYSFSTLMVVSVIWPMVLGAIIWLPLLLTLVELAVRASEREVGNTEHGKSKRSVGLLPLTLAGGLVIGVVILSGHLEYSFYALFSVLFYAVARMVSYGKGGGNASGVASILAALVGMAVLGVMLGGAQLLPFFELARENFRSGLVTYQEVIGYALPKKQILSFVMPDFFGNPTHSAYFDFLQWKNLPVEGSKDLAGSPRPYPFWGVKNYVEAASYIGVLPLLLSIGAPFLRRDRYTITFAAYAIFSLLLAFGSPLYQVFWSIPAFDQLHTPFRWLFPYTFSAAVLAGLGASSLTARKNGPTQDKARGLGQPSGSLNGPTPGLVNIRLRRGEPLCSPPNLPLLAGGILGAVILAALALARWQASFSLALAERLLASSQVIAAAFPSPQALFSYQFRNLLVLGLLLVAGGVIVALRPHSTRGRAFLVLCVAADLFYFGYTYNAAADPRLLEFTPPSVRMLQADQGVFRVASYNLDDNLTPNTAMLSGIQDARGYDSIILRQYADFWRLLEEPHGLLYNRIHKLTRPESLQSTFLDLMNVKYVLTTRPLDLPNGESYLRETYRGEILIYENTDFLPRAFVIGEAQVAGSREEALAIMSDRSFDPRKAVVLETGGEPLPASTKSALVPARITSYGANQVVVENDAPQGGYLVLTDNYFSGWRAWVDGRETRLYRAYGTFRAIQLPTGAKRIEFRYSPDSFNLGLLTTLLAGLGLIAGTAFWGWRKVARRLETATPIQRLAKNVSVPMGIQLLNRLLDLAFAIFMLRLLGPVNAGKYAFVVVLIGYFIVLTDFGLSTLTTREVAKSKDQANRYLSNSALLRLSLTGLSVPLFAAILGFYSWRSELSADTAWTGFLLLASIVPSGLASALSSIFMANERMEYTAAVSLVGNLLKLALGVLVLMLGFGIVGLGIVSVVVSGSTAALLYYLFRRNFFKPSLEVDFQFQRQMLMTSYPLMANNFLSSIFFRIDVMLLKPMQGDQAIGFYTTAYKFIDGLVIIPSLFTLAVFPVLARYAHAGGDALLRAYTLSLRALLLLGMPLTVGLCLLSERIILLFFGQDYAPAGLALLILIWFLPFSFVNSLTQYVLIAVNQQRFLTLAFVIGATFNIAANLVLIPIYSFQGAAVATVLSEIVLLLPFMYAVRKHVGRVPLLEIAWRPVVSSGVMGVVMLWLQTLNMAALVATGATVYVGMLLALRTFTHEDRALVNSLLGR